MNSPWPCLALLVSLAACNEGPPVKTARLPDGSWRLTCSASLTVCADRAESLCKDRGLSLLSGRSEHRMYGHETGVSQVEARSSELTVKCVERKGDVPAAVADAPVLARPDAAESPAPPPAAIAKSAARACVPGSTQRCVGAGACSGGQACLADGSAFGPCECASSPAAQPPPPDMK